MPCEEHLAQLREQHEAHGNLGAVLLVVANAPPTGVADLVTREALGAPLLSDPSRRAYTAFGLARARPWELVTWNTVVAYARGLLQGRWPRWPRGDVAQLGGDFVIDPRGGIVFAHRCRNPADWPPVEVILEAVRIAANGANEERR